MKFSQMILLIFLLLQCSIIEKEKKSSTDGTQLLALHLATTATLSYGSIANSVITYTVNYTISNLTPMVTNLNPTTYLVNPSLPSGLSISKESGIISGIPSQTVSTKTSYTITASSSSASATTTIRLLIGPNGFFNCSYKGTSSGCTDQSIGFTCTNSPSCYSTLEKCSASDYCI